jgi:prepilin peptidase CpaA
MKFEVIYVFVLINLLVVGYFDFKTRKIKNVWSILNLFFGALFLMLSRENYLLDLTHFYYPLAFFLATFFFFWLKIMGAGDSKYLTTFFFLIPTKLHENFLFFLVLTTCVIGLIFLFRNIIKRRKMIFQELMTGKLKTVYFKLGSKIPYAPVALLAWLWLGIDYFKIYEKIS